MTRRSASSVKTVETIINSVTLMDNLYMARFFDGQPACIEKVLRAILKKPDLVVGASSVEHRLTSLQSRSVCLDVLAVDAQGNRYDLEIQSDSRGARPRRARFYSAMMDSGALPKGADFSELPHSFVIFIVHGDALGLDCPVYHVERVVQETGDVFDDGSHIVYVNAAYNHEDKELADIMHDFMCSDPADMRCSILAERAAYLKETEEGAKSMGTVVDGILQQWREDCMVEARAECMAEAMAEARVKCMAEIRAEYMAEIREECMAEAMAECMAAVKAECMDMARAEVLAEAKAAVKAEIKAEAMEKTRAELNASLATKLLDEGVFDHERIAGLLGVTVEWVNELATSLHASEPDGR